MHTESCAHIVYCSCLCGKLMDVSSAVVSQADIFPLKQNISNWITENSWITLCFSLFVAEKAPESESQTVDNPVSSEDVQLTEKQDAEHWNLPSSFTESHHKICSV